MPIQWTKETESIGLEGGYQHRRGDLTVCVFCGAEAISSSLHWLLQKHWSEGIHCDVESETDQSEHTHDKHNWRHENEEGNRGSPSLEILSIYKFLFLEESHTV